VPRLSHARPHEFPGFSGSFTRSPELDPDGKPVDTLYPSQTPKHIAGEPVGQPSWRLAAGKPSR